MKRELSKTKRAIFSMIALVIVLCGLNGIARMISPKDSAFWQNPLMVMYPVDKFDPDVTVQQYNFSKDPNRTVRYVPDTNRWYRLDPEPLIPEKGNLVLHFGDSSTWGWGLPNRSWAYPLALEKQLPKGAHSINLGIPGYSSLQGLRYMQEILPKYRERILAVTIYFGNNDSTENGSADVEKVGKKLGGFVRVGRHLPLFRIVQDGVARIVQNNNRAPRVNPGEYEKNLEQMIGLAQSYGIQVILIEPPRHLSWQPAYLTYTKSLRSQIGNAWVKGEIAVACDEYAKGLELVYQQKDECEISLTNALDHDWVVPRIKTEWLSKLRSLKYSTGVAYVATLPAWTSAEEYAFVDYCHPSSHLHAQIAEEIRLALKE